MLYVIFLREFCNYDLYVNYYEINYFTLKMKYFDLKMFKSEKQNFEYGLKKIENISGEVTLSYLEKKNKQKCQLER